MKVRPTVLAFRDQPFIHKHISCARIWFGTPTFTYGDKRIGFFNPGGHDPARAVIFEASPDNADAIAQECCRKRVAGLGLIDFAVEGEVNHGRASGPTARIELI